VNNAIDNALEAIRHANPVPDPVDLADAMLRSDVFLTTTKETSMSIDTDQPTHEMPPHRPSGRRRKLLALVGAFAMAVVVVVGSGVLLASGDGDDPSPAAPASVLGPTAVYDGETCVYDGPSEFNVGSTVTFTVTNESENLLVGFSVWWFPSGVAPEKIHEQGILGATGFDD
jgi:hypothetical protein